jgi:hypothetical protein
MEGEGVKPPAGRSGEWFSYPGGCSVITLVALNPAITGRAEEDADAPSMVVETMDPLVDELV